MTDRVAERFIDRMGFAAIAATKYERAVSESDLRTDVAAALEPIIEYVNLLQDELVRSGGYMHVHGWGADPEAVKRGKRLRAITGIKGTGE